MTTETVLKAVQDHAQATASELNNVNQRVKTLSNEIADLAQKSHGAPYGFGGTATKSATQQVLADVSMQAMVERKSRAASVPLNVSVKALVGDAGNTTGNSVYPVLAQRGSQMGADSRRKLSIFDAIQSIKANSGTYEFVSLDGFTNAAAIQAKQGATKATQEMAFELKTVTIATIAALLPMSEQVLSDSPSLGQFIQDKMTHAALDKLEAEVIAGAGGVGGISGLKTEATAFTATATNVPDAIGEAIAELENNGFNAGLIVMSPSQWQAIRSERTAGGEYVAGGWAEPNQPSVYGVPVITSSSLTGAEVLVLDPMQVALLDRESPRLELGYTGTQFAENIVTARMELRAGLAVFSKAAVLSVTVGS